MYFMQADMMRLYDHLVPFTSKNNSDKIKTFQIDLYTVIVSFKLLLLNISETIMTTFIHWDNSHYTETYIK